MSEISSYVYIEKETYRNVRNFLFLRICPVRHPQQKMLHERQIHRCDVLSNGRWGFSVFPFSSGISGVGANTYNTYNTINLIS